MNSVDGPSKEFIRVQELARRAISPLRPANNSTIARKDFLHTGKRAVRGSELPAPYLLYFLLVELLEFRDLGSFEKLAWSIPVDFEGRAYLIEHRKFGVGIFVQDDADVDNAKKIARIVEKAIRHAQPYFKWKAERAVAASEFNVANKSRILFDRYIYLLERAKEIFDEAKRRKDEVIRKENGPMSWTITRPAFRLEREARWLAIAAIEAFFSWNEHVFIHISILNSRITTGKQFTELSGADWSAKFKLSLDISDKSTKRHYDNLSILRRQLRNFVAHGAFGKDGEALSFHSNAGAVPVLFDVAAQKDVFSLGETLEFDVEAAFSVMAGFVEFLWSGPRKVFWVYIQDYGLPAIMTMAQDGTYKSAMKSLEEMEGFADHLAQKMDDFANMDW